MIIYTVKHVANKSFQYVLQLLPGHTMRETETGWDRGAVLPKRRVSTSLSFLTHLAAEFDLTKFIFTQNEIGKKKYIYYDMYLIKSIMYIVV